MKRLARILIVAALAFVSVNASAQMSVGFGFVSSNVYGKDLPADTKNLNGFYLGANYDWAFSPLYGLTFEPGAYFEYRGRSIAGKQNNSYSINVPLNIKYSYEIDPMFTVSGFTGPRFNMGFGNYYKKYTGNSCNRNFNVQWGLGVALTYAEAIQIRTGYDFGLSKAYRFLGEPVKVRRGEFHVGIAFLF